MDHELGITTVEGTAKTLGDLTIMRCCLITIFKTRNFFRRVVATQSIHRIVCRNCGRLASVLSEESRLNPLPTSQDM